MLVYIHKEQMLNLVQCQYPGRHYVMVDDKLRMLAAMKDLIHERLTTVSRVGAITRWTQPMPPPIQLPILASSVSVIWSILNCTLCSVRKMRPALKRRNNEPQYP